MEVTQDIDGDYHVEGVWHVLSPVDVRVLEAAAAQEYIDDVADDVADAELGMYGQYLIDYLPDDRLSISPRGLEILQAIRNYNETAKDTP